MNDCSRSAVENLMVAESPDLRYESYDSQSRRQVGDSKQTEQH